jgi:hypothetical protein
MSVRPMDLTVFRSQYRVLHCGECLVDYSASPAPYTCLPEDKPIVCVGCGTELSLEDKLLVDA